MNSDPIPQCPVNDPDLHEAFLRSDRPHILQITNHGIHDWEVVPGLPDTGGQNIFVNEMTRTLADIGYRITVVNRGGFQHPRTGRLRRGLDYRDACQRIFSVEDTLPEFVRKEAMQENISILAESLLRFLLSEQLRPDLIVSHYWDAAAIAVSLNRRWSEKCAHFWIPHSLGTIKKRNMPPETWADLRLDERIATESKLLGEVDGVVATSSAIRRSLHEDYGCATDLFLPPCVDADVFRPREVSNRDPVWSLLADASGLDPESLRRARIITEISRTDRTKRKDLLIEAFAEVHREFEDTLLVLTVDPEESTADDLRSLAENRGVADRVVPLGSIRRQLPELYAISSVYCTPSVMEGFGMSLQEAAACGLPAVASDLVPFAVEYLLGGKPRIEEGDEKNPRVREGEGAIVVEADYRDGFVRALRRLLTDESLRLSMGRRAREITVPFFTWEDRMKKFTEAAGFRSPAPEAR